MEEGERMHSSSGSIYRRVTLALVGVSVLTLVIVAVFFYGFLGRYVVEREQERLRDHATEVARQVEGVQSQETAPGPPAWRMLRLLLEVDLQVLPKGAGISILRGEEVLATAGSVPELLAPSEIQDLAGGVGTRRAIVGQEEVSLLLAAARVHLQEGGEGVVVVTLPREEAVAGRSGLFRVLLVPGIVGVGVAVFVGLVLAAWLVRPLKRLADAARTIGRGSYEHPVTGSFPGEVYELASSLETMRTEVWRSERSLRGFVASAAHELRTPLTSIQGFSQALLDGTASTEEEKSRSAAAIQKESGRLRRLVDALLILSRFDSREFKPNLAVVDVAGVVREEIDALVEGGSVQAGRIEIEISGETELTTDQDMLRQVVSNLLRNAVQYGGGEPIRVRLGRRGEAFSLEVLSGGGNLLPDEADRVFERFFRGSASGGVEGFGLGLPLVREICRVLGGEVTVHVESDATVFRVRLPAVQEKVGVESSP